MVTRDRVTRRRTQNSIKQSFWDHRKDTYYDLGMNYVCIYLMNQDCAQGLSIFPTSKFLPPPEIRNNNVAGELIVR